MSAATIYAHRSDAPHDEATGCMVLKSRRVVPQRLLDAGFAFEFPEWSAAARDLVAKHKGGVC
jgi:hypothetical protein